MEDSRYRFRAWDNQKNKWATNNDVQGSTGLEFGVNDYFINIAGERMARWSFMQFTGLKDKNGKPIFEGDLIRIQEEGEIMEIRWSQRFASFVIKREGWTFSHYFGEAVEPEDVEVISNIFESPELINHGNNKN